MPFCQESVCGRKDEAIPLAAVSTLCPFGALILMPDCGVILQGKICHQAGYDTQLLDITH